MEEDPVGSDGATSTTTPTNIGALKGILTGCILLLGLVSVFTPRRLTGAPAIFSLGNMMASGVLLSAGLVHQLADSAIVLNQPDKFPWAMFVAGLTFLLFLVLEESLHLILGGGGAGECDDHNTGPLDLHGMMHGGSKGHGHSHQHSSHVGHSHSQSPSDHDDDDDNDVIDDENDHSFNITTPAHRHSHSHKQHQHVDELPPSSEHQPLLLRHSIYTATTAAGEACSRMSISCSALMVETATATNNHSISHSLTGPSTHSHARPSQFGSFLQSTKSHKEDPFMLTEHHHHDDHIDLHLHGSILASGILMLALSIHSLLAGISIGIETKVDTITGTAIAILAHKAFEGFCLGSSLVNAQLDHVPFLVLGISFSCATPLGIVVGQLLMEGLVDGMGGDKGETIIALVQAVVAGTFLYIAIVEIGAKELLVCREEVRVSENDSLSMINNNLQRQRQIDAGKLVCFSFGFLAMSALAAVV